MDKSRFQISEEKSLAGVAAFQLPFSMDTMEIDELLKAVMAGLEQMSQEKWMIDLSEVEYMGSSMLGLMVNIGQRIRQGGGKLILFGLSPSCCKASRPAAFSAFHIRQNESPRGRTVLARL